MKAQWNNNIAKFFFRTTSFVLSFSIAFSGPYTALAGSRITKSEVDSSLQVAEQYTKMVNDFEKILDAEQSDRLALDSFSLLQQLAVPSPKGRRVVPWWDLKVSVQDWDSFNSEMIDAVKTELSEQAQKLSGVGEDESIDDDERDRKRLDLKRNAEAIKVPGWSPIFETNMKNNGNYQPGIKPSVYECSSNKPCLFSLTDSYGYHYNLFTISVEKILTFGEFIILVRKDSYDAATKRQTLSVIDLETYGAQIGNEEIPVFEFDIEMDGPVQDMVVADKVVKFNGGKQYLHPGQLKDISHLMSVAFNVKANLVNPATFEGAMTLAENMAEYVDKISEVVKDTHWDEEENAQRVMVDYAKLKGKIVKDISLQMKREAPRAKLDNELTSAKNHGRKVIGEAAKVLASEEAAEYVTPEQKELVQKFVENLGSDQTFDSAVLGTQQNIQEGRKLLSSVKKFVTYMASPRPSSINAIKNAIAITMANLKMSAMEAHADMYDPNRSYLFNKVKLTAAQAGARVTKLAEWLSGRKMATGGMVASSLLAVAFPESFAVAMDMGLNFGSGIFEYLRGMAVGTASAFSEGGGPVLEILNPLRSWDVIDQAYVNGGAWTRLMIGVAGWTSTVIAILGSYHVGQNIVRLALDMRKPGYQGFIPRVEKMEKEYKEALAKAEAERLRKVSDKAAEFANQHPDEVEKLNQKARTRISEVEKLQEQQWKSSWLYKGTRPFVWTYQGTKAAVLGLGKVTIGKALKALAGKDIGRFLYALKTFIFSFASYTRTALDYSAIWNWWSGFRYSTFTFSRIKLGKHRIPYFVKVKPLGLAIRGLFPKLFNRVVATQVGRTTIATESNGGTHFLANIIGRLTNAELNKAFLGTSADFVKKQKAATKKYEEDVTALEAKVVGQVMHKAMEALLRFVQDEKQLKSMFESNGVTSIASKGFQELTYANKTFLRSYFDRVMDKAMEKALAEVVSQQQGMDLKEVLAQEAVQVMPNDTQIYERLMEAAREAEESGEVSYATLEDLKKMIVAVNQSSAGENQIKLELPEDRIASIVKEVASAEDHYGIAAGKAKKAFLSAENVVKNIKYDFTTYLDPAQNASLQRYAVVQRMRNDAQAMSRAVRQETVEMFTTLPIDLGFKLAFTAGITDGPLKPLQPDFMGPNSVFYLSRMGFYNNLASGIALGALANAWYKLQEDAFNADEGNYGSVPKGEYKDIGFARFWWRKFRSPKNTTMVNYKRGWSIAAPNIPAALPNMAALQLSPIGLGRLDLSLIVMGYALYALPIHAFFMRFEQAFELAANYDAKYFDEELWDHPDVQAFLAKKSAMRRVKFNLIRDLALNPVGEALQNIEVTPTSTHGTRGWLRAILPGEQLPEEAIVNGANSLAESTKDVPVLNKLTEAIRNSCASVLDANYDEWTKIKK